MTNSFPTPPTGNVVTEKNSLPADLKHKVELLAATPDELMPGFTPVERAIIQAVKLFSVNGDTSMESKKTGT